MNPSLKFSTHFYIEGLTKRAFFFSSFAFSNLTVLAYVSSTSREQKGKGDGAFFFFSLCRQEAIEDESHFLSLRKSSGDIQNFPPFFSAERSPEDAVKTPKVETIVRKNGQTFHLWDIKRRITARGNKKCWTSTGGVSCLINYRATVIHLSRSANSFIPK